jgi:hypothetical protein
MKKLDQYLNTYEGWGLFYGDGAVQIEGLDGHGLGVIKFENHTDAQLFVIAKAIADKSQRHIRALKEIYNNDVPVSKSEWIKLCDLARWIFNIDLGEWMTYYSN